jgi:hypothetical protein
LRGRCQPKRAPLLVAGRAPDSQPRGTTESNQSACPPAQPRIRGWARYRQRAGRISPQRSPDRGAPSTS